MAHPNELCLVLVIFLSIFSLSSLPTSALILKANVSLLIPSSQLVENLCNGKAVQNRRFCLKALSTTEVIAAMDTTQLGTLIMKLGVANAKATLNVYNEIIKKPCSPQALKAFNCCVEAYKYAILSLEMVVEDPKTANYDVAVIGPEIANCEKKLINAKVQAPRLNAAHFLAPQHLLGASGSVCPVLEIEAINVGPAPEPTHHQGAVLRPFNAPAWPPITPPPVGHDFSVESFCTSSRQKTTEIFGYLQNGKRKHSRYEKAEKGN
ncbi:hypothetical protein J1N35_030108 [Gossypium stocksii]|uniref:Pectinesterase inhibitor domain-containing protein n=1 Tax=Gossypium stocksii TaxID=47602 RepID=A0A9D3ZSM2_9ROSI|nr:hypothetical protein J1N35_030108 [Gossypium stocksii]